MTWPPSYFPLFVSPLALHEEVRESSGHTVESSGLESEQPHHKVCASSGNSHMTHLWSRILSVLRLELLEAVACSGGRARRPPWNVICIPKALCLLRWLVCGGVGGGGSSPTRSHIHPAADFDKQSKELSGLHGVLRNLGLPSPDTVPWGQPMGYLSNSA